MNFFSILFEIKLSKMIDFVEDMLFGYSYLFLSFFHNLSNEESLSTGLNYTVFRKRWRSVRDRNVAV